MNDPLITASLLGSARSAALPSPPAPQFDTAWEAMRAKSPAESLLHALAVSRAFRLAGKRTSEASPAPEPAPIDDSPRLSDAETDALQRMLRGEFQEVMPEWLAEISLSDRIAPARILPEIFAAGKKDTFLASRPRTDRRKARPLDRRPTFGSHLAPGFTKLRS